MKDVHQNEQFMAATTLEQNLALHTSEEEEEKIKNAGDDVSPFSSFSKTLSSACDTRITTGVADVFHEFKFKTAQCLQEIQDVNILKRALILLYTKV